MTLPEIFTKPDVTEMQNRLARLQAGMADQGLDAYVLAGAENVLWLTNFANYVHERPFIMVVPARGKPVFVIPRLELDHVESRLIGDVDYAIYPEFPAPEGKRWNDILGGILPGGSGAIAVEPTCPVMVTETLAGRGRISHLIDDCRAIKSTYEQGRIAYACRLLSDAHADLLANARPGLSQSDISTTYGGAVMRQLATDEPNMNPIATRVLTLIQNGDASHDPHNFSDLAMAMKPGGPHVSVFNAVMNGYGAEIERTFFLGHVPDAAKKPFDVMMQARRKVFEMTRPGAVMNDVDAAANAIFRQHGYGDAMRHRAGHGMGVTSHEGPFLAEGEHKVIQPGMVFTIEPGIYLDGIGGFRHSDTVMTTETGLVTLTSGPDDLDGLTL